MKTVRYLSSKEQWEQADRCRCHGSDDYCVCQNLPDQVTRQRWVAEEIAKVLVDVKGDDNG